MVLELPRAAKGLAMADCQPWLAARVGVGMVWIGEVVVLVYLVLLLRVGGGVMLAALLMAIVVLVVAEIQELHLLKTTMKRLLHKHSYQPSNSYACLAVV